MNIHEHQAKDILRGLGCPVPEGRVVLSEKDAQAAIDAVAGPVRVVKAQTHAGGRGAGRFRDVDPPMGGVKVAPTRNEALDAVRGMLGRTLVTKQTGAKGRVVRRVYVEQGAAIDREFYLGALVDRGSGAVSFIASREGGMEIEEVAAKTPDAIVKVEVNPVTGLSPYHGRSVAYGLGLEGNAAKQTSRIVAAMYRAFTTLDASMVEINPLVRTKDGDMLVLDAKMSFDDNALFRHPEVAKLHDEAEEDPTEAEAQRKGLNYIKLDGTVGCLVNGAGLAMATMDIIKLKGGDPANFLDVGGGATKEQVSAAFRIILSDDAVRGILVNIFGGIMRCDTIAEGIVAAAKEVDLTIPLVVRLMGTNMEEGRRILGDSGLALHSFTDLGEAASKVVALTSV